MLGVTGCLIHELLGVDALYPTGGLGGAAPPTIVAALAVGGAETTADLEALAKQLNPIPAVQVPGFFDPLNLAEAEFWGESNEATIGFLRHAEIKHGRVAMAGFVGYCVHANGIHFPWKIPGDEICAPGVAPTELWQNIPLVAKLQIIGTIGFFEFYSEAAMSQMPDANGVTRTMGRNGWNEGPGGAHYMRGGKPGVFPSFQAAGSSQPDATRWVKGLEGKYGSVRQPNSILPHPVPLDLWDPFGFTKNMSEEKKAQKLRVEIMNGRLAMIGLMAFLSEGAIPGSVPALKGLIPATGEINVMAPLDFTQPFFASNA
jgi:hypothetical protein